LSLSAGQSALAESAETPPPSDLQKQVAGILVNDFKAHVALSAMFQQLDEAHLKIADFQNPESPDDDLNKADAVEMTLLNRFEGMNDQIGKNLSTAIHIILGDEQHETFSNVTEALTDIDRRLIRFQALLSDSGSVAVRETFKTHLADVIDAWIQAHPDADRSTTAAVLVMCDPRQIDVMIQNERKMFATALEALSKVQ
jgi:methionine synthase II (cobalamin-independent)